MAARRPQGNQGSAVPPTNANRQNEYFVPRDGIDREVITADICRYLGNDALVRPGNYTDETGRVIQGYYITAYRNLTSAMIADLKNDSARWDQERRKHQSGAVRYQDSNIRDNGPRGGYNAQPPPPPPPPPAYTGGPSFDNPGPRYPGADSPGYSAAVPPAPAGYPGQGYGGQPAYAQYPGQQPQYPPPQSQDPRYAGAPMGATGMPGGYGNPGMVQDPTWNNGAHYGVAPGGNVYPVDTPMTDAPLPPRPQPAPYGNPPRPGGFAPNPAAGYPAYPPTSGPGNAFATQPVDSFYGRASPAAGFSPGPPDQHGSSAARRDRDRDQHRERDRTDRDRDDTARGSAAKGSSASSTNHHHPSYNSSRR